MGQDQLPNAPVPFTFSRRTFFRLGSNVNERLRALMRYQGELSRYIDEALTRFDSVDEHSTRRESAWRPVSRSASHPRCA